MKLTILNNIFMT